jgi:serine/threonine-protein kinase RsbW
VEIKIVLSLPRDAASVPVTRRLLDCCLETLGVTPETRADLALALTEACANVIRHAGPGDDYEVIVSTRDGRCVIEVVDTGGNGTTRRKRTEAQGGLAEHGRGLKIINAVVDDMSMTGNGRAGTTVHFEKALDWPPGALAEQLFAASG